MNLYKSMIIVILGFSMLTLWWAGGLSDVEAANIPGDCGLVKSIGENTILDNWQYENIFPKAAMIQAMTNLKNFCCQEDVYADNDTVCGQDANIQKDAQYPMSVYLYDHILDIFIRRLDAKVANDNGEDLVYGLEPDETGKKRRDFIIKHANSKDGSIPLQITNMFEKNWTMGKHIVGHWSSRTEDKNHDQLVKDFKDYNDWNLVEKYNGACEASVYLYLELSYDPDKALLEKAYLQCEDLIRNRIQKEYQYTKAVLMQKGNKLLYYNIQSYLDNYFVQNKLIALQQLIFNIKNTFNEINKAIIELVSQCS